MFERKLNNEIQKAKEVLQNADAILITAGAGMGVDSGLPDFRGVEGFWRAYPIAKKLGLRFEELANPRWFRENPKLAWAFYGHRLNLYRKTKPHEGFYLLKKLGERKKGGYFVFTSNVDGQFQKAGFDEKRIVEIHGSIHHLQCTVPCMDDIWSADGIEIDIDMEKFEAKEPLPLCRHCKEIARPNILMFGDWEWISHRTAGQEFLFERWLEKIDDMGYNLAIIEIGAGKAVPTVRMLSERVADNFYGTLIRINPRDYDVPSSRHISIPLGGLEGIKKIIEGIL
ncbi:NAD-dependent protein deacetylase, SIR2 family [Persephonella hydrogeniphila]|uniref:protein acetyllysine N-acetyltransferase n=1 Tax=Persephonella hydrogeniphila TaxID=198703 RepID=A0A285NL07_9AQUI|nr:Sir2 family NAD-dependent protein deacetylase [Persephonella hydrogeniphila]SNZ10145.1 NAD-dependent protein deacetylase, SIR2 family [Persephonella hydrogeniphila]